MHNESYGVKCITEKALINGCLWYMRKGSELFLFILKKTPPLFISES